MEPIRNELIGQRVRFYRKAKDLTLEGMVVLMDDCITGQQLARYETGQSRWPADLLCKIAVALRIDIRLLTGLEDGKHEGKDTEEWEAEKYKNIILRLTPNARKIVYSIVADIAKSQIPQAGH